MKNRIGIDFHGVISSAPEAFAAFCSEIRRKGIAVYVISGGPKDDIVKYLREHHIEYDHVWAILDFCADQGTAAFFDDGSFQVPTEIWNRAKAEYCAGEGIEFHIDDSSVYGRYFVTPYCKYDLHNDVCELKGGVQVDFKNPADAAAQVAALVLGKEPL